MSDADVVELTSHQAYQTAGQTGIGGGSYSWDRAANGYRAQAELTRRLTAQLVRSSDQAAEAARRLENYTVWLIRLTVVLIVLTVALFAVGIITMSG